MMHRSGVEILENYFSRAEEMRIDLIEVAAGFFKDFQKRFAITF
jgi:hypothetical protein